MNWLGVASKFKLLMMFSKLISNDDYVISSFNILFCSGLIVYLRRLVEFRLALARLACLMRLMRFDFPPLPKTLLIRDHVVFCAAAAAAILSFSFSAAATAAAAAAAAALASLASAAAAAAALSAANFSLYSLSDCMRRFSASTIFSLFSLICAYVRLHIF